MLRIIGEMLKNGHANDLYSMTFYLELLSIEHNINNLIFLIDATILHNLFPQFLVSR